MPNTRTTIRTVSPIAASPTASAASGPRVPLLIEGAGADSIGDCRVVSDNLSEAWLAAFNALMASGVSRLAPIVVTITGFSEDGHPHQTPAVEALIDAELRRDFEAQCAKNPRFAKYGARTCASTAETIFPSSMWHPGGDRADLFARYIRIVPRLKRHPLNKNGIYFERLIKYGRGPNEGNQLEHMIDAFNRDIKRKSAYQASIADPERDQKKTPYLIFPCLQQIAVDPSRSTGTLALTGFYGTQYLYERAYGNFLGLSELGRFLASEMGLRLTRVTCVASHAPVEEAMSKSRGRALITAANGAIAAAATVAPSPHE